eukprot:614257-Prorocentrum_minimum.AAC.2
MESIAFASSPAVARMTSTNNKQAHRPNVSAKASAKRIDRQVDRLAQSFRSLGAKSSVLRSRGVAARVADTQCGWFDKKEETPKGGKQTIVVIGNGMVGLKFLQYMTELDVGKQFEHVDNHQ